jgi:hypothetical protein
MKPVYRMLEERATREMSVLFIEPDRRALRGYAFYRCHVYYNRLATVARTAGHVIYRQNSI